MALRPLVSKLRLLLYPPAYLLELLVFLICGRLLVWISRVIYWISNGAKTHVWRVLVIARRWTRSEPTWLPDDILVGGLTFQPFTNAQREVAKADPRLRHVVCPCGKPRCRFPHGTFVPNHVIDLGALIRAEAARVEAEMNEKRKVE